MTRSTGLAAILLVIASIFLPMRPLAMELKIVGDQIILSGPVVGDEPGKIREALGNTPGRAEIGSKIAATEKESAHALITKGDRTGRGPHYIGAAAMEVSSSGFD